MINFSNLKSPYRRLENRKKLFKEAKVNAQAKYGKLMLCFFSKKPNKQVS